MSIDLRNQKARSTVALLAKIHRPTITELIHQEKQKRETLKGHTKDTAQET